jgi:hypothetical protein
MERWIELKFLCEDGQNQFIVEEIKNYCRLERNKNLPYLERTEGGFGGNNNMIHKQIRFRMSWSTQQKDIDNDIVMKQILNTETEKWTYDELDDLIYGFVKMANNYVKEQCVHGCIEMINKNYLDSDDE